MTQTDIPVVFETAESGTPVHAATQPASGEQSVLNPHPYLAPPQKPDELGWLAHYRVLGVLGSGGMGIVFQAEDPRLKRRVALKVMLPQYATSNAARTRFLREARSQAAIEHDHVAAIFDVGLDRGVPYLAMPLLKGQSLADSLKANPNVPIAEAVRIAREIATGLAAAHAKNLVHRDIKPGNIWLEEKTRRVKILDFGLARAADGEDADTVTQEGTPIGTPAYMSPEQARGETLDFRSDLFSLGAVMYLLITGRNPFRAKNATGMLLAVVNDMPPPLESMCPDAPPALAALTMSLLEKFPESRPHSTERVVEQLREIEMALNVTGLVPVFLAPPAYLPNDPWSSIDTTEIAVPSSAEPPPKANRSRPWMLYACLALFLPMAAAAVFVIRIITADGTLIVEINDESVETRIKGGKLVLLGPDGKEKYTLSIAKGDTVVRPGDYRIRVVGADRLEVDTPEFKMVHGGKVTVLVKLDPKAQAEVHGKKPWPPSVTDADRKVAEWVLKLGGRVRMVDERDLPSIPPDYAPEQWDDPGGPNVTDAKQVTQLPKKPFVLTKIELHGVGEGALSAGFENIKHLKHLVHLDLSGSEIQDAEYLFSESNP
ncbi:MAG: serine/threonine-protein kinase [Gemmataceae bacterium]